MLYLDTMMQHLLCVSSQIPLGYWEKPVEKMEKEILCLGAGMCFFTYFVTSNGDSFLPFWFRFFLSSAVHFHFHCMCQWSRLDSVLRQVLRWSLFYFCPPLFAVQSAPLWWVVTCLRAKSWQAAWQSKGPALAAKRAHITHPPVARSYGYSKWQTTVNTLTLFIYLSVCVHVCLCACVHASEKHNTMPCLCFRMSGWVRKYARMRFLCLCFVSFFFCLFVFTLFYLFVSFLLFVWVFSVVLVLNPVQVFTQMSTHPSV